MLRQRELLVKVVLEEELYEDEFTRVKVKSVSVDNVEAECHQQQDGSHYWPFFDTEDMDDENLSPLVLSVLEDRM